MAKADLEFMQAEWRMDPDKSTLDRLAQLFDADKDDIAELLGLNMALVKDRNVPHENSRAVPREKRCRLLRQIAAGKISIDRAAGESKLTPRKIHRWIWNVRAGKYDNFLPEETIHTLKTRRIRDL